MLNNQSKNMTALYKDLKCDLHLKGKEGEKYVAMENFFLRMGLQIVSRSAEETSVTWLLYWNTTCAAEISWQIQGVEKIKARVQKRKKSGPLTN